MIVTLENIGIQAWRVAIDLYIGGLCLWDMAFSLFGQGVGFGMFSVWGLCALETIHSPKLLASVLLYISWSSWVYGRAFSVYNVQALTEDEVTDSYISKKYSISLSTGYAWFCEILYLCDISKQMHYCDVSSTICIT